jgi:hypothetical protein
MITFLIMFRSDDLYFVVQLCTFRFRFRFRFVPVLFVDGAVSTSRMIVTR